MALPLSMSLFRGKTRHIPICEFNREQDFETSSKTFAVVNLLET